MPSVRGLFAGYSVGSISVFNQSAAPISSYPLSPVTRCFVTQWA